MTETASLSQEPASTAHRYADRKGIWGWMLFDWAAQPFHTVIITFVFAPYFASAAVTNISAEAFLGSIGLGFLFTSEGADAGAGGQALWGYATGIGGLCIAVTAPILGAIADASGPRKPWVLSFGILGAFGCLLLWMIIPNSVDLGLAFLAIIFAMIGFEFSAVFNNAMMPDLVPRSKLGRLSGNGWAIGYLGGLFSLVFVLGFLAAPASTGKTLLGLDPLFGLNPEAREGDRASGPLTAIWFLVFIIPFVLFTPDTPRKPAANGAIAKGIGQLVTTVKSLPKQRSYFSFLVSSMFYRDALAGLYTFGGIYAANVLQWTITQIGIFGILANITGALGAWLGGKMDDRYGSKLVVTFSIVMLALCCLTVISLSPTEIFFTRIAENAGDTDLPNILFYICGCAIGAFGGSLQAASRTLLTDQVPREQVTEAFGLYALSGKATTFLAPFSIALVTGLFGDNRIGVSPVILLFLIGLVLLVWVQGRGNIRAAA